MTQGYNLQIKQETTKPEMQPMTGEGQTVIWFGMLPGWHVWCYVDCVHSHSYDKFLLREAMCTKNISFSPFYLK